MNSLNNLYIRFKAFYILFVMRFAFIIKYMQLYLEHLELVSACFFLIKVNLIVLIIENFKSQFVWFQLYSIFWYCHLW